MLLFYLILHVHVPVADSRVNLWNELRLMAVCGAQALRGKRLATPVKKRSSKRAPEQLPAKKPRYQRQLVCVISRRQHQNDVQRPRIEHGSAGPVKEGPPSYSPEGRSVKLRSQEKRGKNETSRHNACKTMPIAVLERVLGLGTR